MKKRRLCGAVDPCRCRLVEAPSRNAELRSLVGKVGGDVRAGEDDDADRQRLEEPVIALEGGSAAFAGPVGLEDDLRHLALIGPAGGNTLGAARAAAVSSTISACLARILSSAAQMASWSLQSVPPVKAMREPAGASSSVSARRRAAINSRLSISEAVSAR